MKALKVSLAWLIYIALCAAVARYTGTMEAFAMTQFIGIVIVIMHTERVSQNRFNK